MTDQKPLRFWAPVDGVPKNGEKDLKAQVRLLDDVKPFKLDQHWLRHPMSTFTYGRSPGKATAWLNELNTWPRGDAKFERVDRYTTHRTPDRLFQTAKCEGVGCPFCEQGLPVEKKVFVAVVDRVPVKEHKPRRWDVRGTYHRRIQKKWNARYGLQAGTHRTLVLTEAVAKQLNWKILKNEQQQQ